jgi:hypothetical protein
VSSVSQEISRVSKAKSLRNIEPAVPNLYCFIVPVTMITIIIYIDLLLSFCSLKMILQHTWIDSHEKICIFLWKWCFLSLIRVPQHVFVLKIEENPKRINWRVIYHKLYKAAASLRFQRQTREKRKPKESNL